MNFLLTGYESSCWWQEFLQMFKRSSQMIFGAWIQGKFMISDAPNPQWSCITFSFIHTLIFLCISIRYEPQVWQKNDFVERRTLIVQLFICAAAAVYQLLTDLKVEHVAFKIILQMGAAIPIFWWFYRWIRLYIFGEMQLNYLEDCDEAEALKTQEDFKSAISKWISQIKQENNKSKKDLLEEKTNQMKDKFERLGADTEAMWKNLLWNKLKYSRCGKKMLSWFAKTLEQYSNEHQEEFTVRNENDIKKANIELGINSEKDIENTNENPENIINKPAYQKDHERVLEHIQKKLSKRKKHFGENFININKSVEMTPYENNNI